MRIFSVLATIGLVLVQTTLVASQTGEKDVSFSCLVYEDLSFYDFRKLQNKASDYSIVDSTTLQNYTFNLCSYTLSNCSTANEVFAYRTQGSECTELTNQNLITHVVDTESESYVQIKYGQGGACASDATQNYTLTIDLQCSLTGKDDDAIDILSVDSTDSCNPNIKISHIKGCPVFSVSSFARFLLSRPYILAPIAIVFGLMVCFAGRQFFPWTISIIGCAIGFGITMLLFSMYSMLSSQNSPGETTLFFSIVSYTLGGVIGIFLGFILQKMLHIAAAILGAVGGFFIGVAVYNIVFFFVESSFLLTTLSVLGALGMAILSMKQYDNIVIFGTSLIGSYGVMRGCSLFFGGFPNEFEMIAKVGSGQIGSIESAFYIYVTLFVALFAGGVIYQRRQREHAAKSNYITI